MPGILAPGTDGWAWSLLDLDIPMLLLLAEKTERPGNQYGLGAKPSSLTAQASEIAEGPIDCSGYFRWLLRRTAGVTVPDGSFHQMQWMDDTGFKESSSESAMLRDGIVRAAYMKPLGKDGVGHIALVHGGHTIESSGKRGPGRRP